MKQFFYTIIRINAFFIPYLLFCAFSFIASAHDLDGLATHFSGYDPDTNSKIAKRRDKTASVAASDEAVYLRSAKWPNGATLRLCFFDGSSAIRKEVVTLAEELLTVAGLQLGMENRESPPTCDTNQLYHIRVTFRTQGYWAMIGRDALEVPKSKPTVGLEGFGERTALNPHDRGTVLHEIFHVLGALHEHQRTDSPCPNEIDREAVKRKLGWDDATIDFNLGRLDQLAYFKGKDVTSSDYDAESITHYSLPADLRKRGSATCNNPENIVPSKKDLEFLRDIYQ
jgi:hypothetical protein